MRAKKESHEKHLSDKAEVHRKKNFVSSSVLLKKVREMTLDN